MFVIIRKPHTCWGCGLQYPVGTRMQYIVSADGGEIATAYWCEVCNEYWQRHMMYGDEIGLGELRDGDREGWNKVKIELEEKQV